MKQVADFAKLLANYFSNYLIQQRQCSPHTIASYRDTFRLLALYAKDALNILPQDLTFDDLSAEFLGEFLNHLEQQRGICARSRNTRLAAIRSLFRYVALHEPHYAMLTQQVLAMPVKRYTRTVIDFLVQDEIETLLKAPDPSCRTGRRDHALLLVMIQTGIRPSELIGLRREDVRLSHPGAHLDIHGKGRKQRTVPLRTDSINALEAWFEEFPGKPDSPVFANQRGRGLNADNLDYLLKKNLAVARQRCTTLQNKHITPHSLRHTAAMQLLHSGVDRATIALWLGHESVETTYMYLHADLKIKEQAMARTTPSETPIKRYEPEDAVLALLKSL